MAAQIIEVALGLNIDALTDVALKTAEVQAGILVVKRQFDFLRIHGSDNDKLMAAGRAVLQGMSLTEGDQLAPRILFKRVAPRLTLADVQMIGAADQL